MTTPPQFTPQQTTAAIRSGLRGERRNVDLPAGERERYAATYDASLSHYRQHVRHSLDDGDYLQAAEKSWGAYAQAIKLVAAQHGMKVSHHASIISVAGRLASLAADADPATAKLLRDGLATARSLHQHFYENDLPDDIVAANANDVASAIVQLLYLFPPGLPEN